MNTEPYPKYTKIDWNMGEDYLKEISKLISRANDFLSLNELDMAYISLAQIHAMISELIKRQHPKSEELYKEMEELVNVTLFNKVNKFKLLSLQVQSNSNRERQWEFTKLKLELIKDLRLLLSKLIGIMYDMKLLIKIDKDNSSIPPALRQS